ncbi:unnamed protein product [Phytomonas sp. EM1]|nr:unnamed protein product [Phytomonas sp. EM1]|eukprot:CCW61321.1 unnamed protein product [Phytomonas sp. isolate EM1]
MTLQKTRIHDYLKFMVAVFLLSLPHISPSPALVKTELDLILHRAVFFVSRGFRVGKLVLQELIFCRGFSIYI